MARGRADLNVGAGTINVGSRMAPPYCWTPRPRSAGSATTWATTPRCPTATPSSSTPTSPRATSCSTVSPANSRISPARTLHLKERRSTHDQDPPHRRLPARRRSRRDRKRVRGGGRRPRRRPRRPPAVLDQAVADGMPGIMADVRDGRRSWFGTAGVADTDTGRKRPADRFRIGSITKTFVATVVLQLEAEGRLSLDDTVEQWLPGVVEGNGHDGGAITVRQLLNHTSGIFNYTADEASGRQYRRRTASWSTATTRCTPEAAGGRRHGHPPLLRAGKRLDVLQHQLRARRDDHREGHGPLLRREIDAAHHPPARPDRHLPARHEAAMPRPARPGLLQARRSRPDPTIHDVTEHEPLLRRRRRRDGLHRQRPQPLLPRPAGRQLAAARAAKGDAHHRPHRRRSGSPTATGSASSRRSCPAARRSGATAAGSTAPGRTRWAPATASTWSSPTSTATGATRQHPHQGNGSRDVPAEITMTAQ